MKSDNTRILLYIGAPSNVGGPQLNAIEVGKILRAENVNVTIAALSSRINADQLDAIRKAQIAFIAVPSFIAKFKIVRDVYALLLWLIKIGWKSQDVVVCMGHGGLHYFMRLFVKKEGYLIYRETGPGGSKVEKKHPLFYKYLKNVEGILALSRTAKINIEQDWPVTAPIKVVPEIIPNLTKGFQRDKLMKRAPVVHIGYLGRVIRNKGVFHLVKMWSSLDIGPAILHIHGDGQDIPLIKDYITSHKLESKIVLEGPYVRAELHKILPKLDLVILLPESEGLPATLIEAMAFGVPFVAEDIGLIRDLAEGNENVKVVACNDVAIKAGIEEMVKKIRAGKINPSALQQYYQQRFSYDIVANKWCKALLKPDEFWHKDRSDD
jgi:glycosyltransferase involved in cell wall biosynthesis